MLEFARDQFLWLFAFVGVFFLVYFFARRYRRARVTYGFVWERVAKKLRPPAWKRLLRTIITVVVSLTLLGSLVLYASGLGPPREEETPPLVVYLVIDGTPSMRTAATGGARRELAIKRAAEIMRRLGERDRALLIQFRGGVASAGRWLKSTDQPGELAPTDFAQPDFASLRGLLAGPLPPDVPVSPSPQRLAVWLGDAPPPLKEIIAPVRLQRLSPRWFDCGGVPCAFESIGVAAANDGVADVVYRPARADSPATVSAKLVSGKPPAWRIEDDEGAKLAEGASAEIELPRDLPENVRVVVSTAPDALIEDDRVTLNLAQFSVRRVALCYPASETANALLLDSLKLLLPGREITTKPIATGAREVEADLVVLDRVAPESVKAPLLLAFCALPPALGKLGAPTRAAAGLYGTPRSPDDFTVPDPALISAREVVPLASSDALTPLVTHAQVGTLVARGRKDGDVLYIGFSPHESGFLFVPAGPLLLQRWLGVPRGRASLPPLVRYNAATDIKLSRAGKLELELAQGWTDAQGARRVEITSGPDGRLTLGPLEQPGVYRAQIDGAVAGEITALWGDAREQSGEFAPTPPLDLAGLRPEARRQDWRDLFPGVLLWIALFALVLEWLLWLAGITD
ncbi:MAG: hypothetical protein IT462_08925 [Planctomycetes bacterium]|nr:hypothetical protein [Planctomycetota bacterium]